MLVLPVQFFLPSFLRNKYFTLTMISCLSLRVYTSTLFYCKSYVYYHLEFDRFAIDTYL